MKPQKSFTAKTLSIYTLCRNKRSMPKCSNKYSRAVRLKNMENFEVFLSSYWGTKINIHRFGILATGQKKCLLSWWDKPPDTNFFLIHEIVVQPKNFGTANFSKWPTYTHQHGIDRPKKTIMAHTLHFLNVKVEALVHWLYC